jgi:hypothetical protein
MAKIDVREAEAGPALDAACAEAMGWEFTESHLTIGAHAIEGVEGTVWFYTNKGNVRAVGYDWRGEWRPSTDWGHAGELVEAIQREPVWGKFVDFVGYLDSLCGSVRDSGRETPLATWRNVDALAICRAFLLASGVTEIEASGQD